MMIGHNISIEAPSVASANSHSLLHEKEAGRKVHFDLSLNWGEEEQRAQRGHEARRRTLQLHKGHKILMSDPHHPQKQALSILANSANAQELAAIYARGERNGRRVVHAERTIYKNMREFFKIVRGHPRARIRIRLEWLSERVGLPPNHDLLVYYNTLDISARLELYSLNGAFLNLDSPNLQPLPAVVSQGSSIGDVPP